MISPYSCTIYGPKLSQNQKYDLLVYAPHSENRIEVLHYFYSRLGLEAQASFEAFTEYCSIDADIGSEEISHAIGQYLSSLYTNASIAVLTISLPRNIIDLNRNKETAIHNIGEKSDAEYLSGLYDNTLEKVHEFFMQSHKVLHIHTMAARNGDFAYNFQKKSLQDLAKIRNMYSGDIRPICLFEKDPKGNLLAPAHTLHAIENSLVEAGYSVKRDVPYSMSNEVFPFYTWKEGGNVVLDIPKHYIATKETAHVINPSQIELCPKKMGEIACMISEGIVTASNPSQPHPFCIFE